MEPQNLTERLNELIRARYNKLDEQHVSAIDYGDIADSVLRSIDKPKANILVAHAANQQLRQMARAICRQRIVEDETAVNEQADLFDYKLQPRYAIQRDNREMSVLREDLTYAERELIETRLRNEGNAKIKHADRLHTETDRLIAEGKLPKPSKINAA